MESLTQRLDKETFLLEFQERNRDRILALHVLDEINEDDNKDMQFRIQRSVGTLKPA